MCCVSAQVRRCDAKVQAGSEVLSIWGQRSEMDTFKIPTYTSTIYACSSRLKWLNLQNRLALCDFQFEACYDMAWSFEIFSPSEWLCERNEKLWWTGGIENAAEGERGVSGCQTFTQPTTTFSMNNFGLLLLCGYAILLHCKVKYYVREKWSVYGWLSMRLEN